ncbi:hypothetical protein L6452_08153 [Arctium lappa]|uniref:Uncharacterized protein n=1 Tax=Arctium lappa TaxID=4217 RepID=A0ACB9DGQ4_ARCLA|nr:hypothetical protein L6452_08153 [Arctium lappa]
MTAACRVSKCPKCFDLARSARTDKGVSVVGQVVSGKFYVDPPGFVECLNNNLPPQFRVFGYKSVTASFSAKKLCDRRRHFVERVSALSDCDVKQENPTSLSNGNSKPVIVECKSLENSSDLGKGCYINGVGNGVGVDIVNENVFCYELYASSDKELHQIRKMIGVAVAIMRNCAPESLMETALQ